MGRGVRPSEGRGDRRLFRIGRSFATRHAGGLADSARRSDSRCRSAHVRGPDGRRVGRAHRRIATFRGHRGIATIPLAVRDRPIPASFSQESLWFLDKLDPGRPTFHVAAGPAGIDAGRRRARPCVCRIVRRHEALRTTFTAVDGVPVQVIGPPSGRPLEYVDLSTLPADQRRLQAESLVRSSPRRGSIWPVGRCARGLVLTMSDTDMKSSW